MSEAVNAHLPLSTIFFLEDFGEHVDYFDIFDYPRKAFKVSIDFLQK